MSQTLPNMLENTIAKIREMVDVNSVIGTPITTPDGVKVLLWGGFPTVEQFAICRKIKPDVAILQRSVNPEDVALKADFAAAMGAKIVIPHHHDFRGVDDPAVVDLFEQEYLARVPNGRFIKPVHGEWIEL